MLGLNFLASRSIVQNAMNEFMKDVMANNISDRGNPNIRTKKRNLSDCPTFKYPE